MPSKPTFVHKYVTLLSQPIDQNNKTPVLQYRIRLIPIPHASSQKHIPLEHTHTSPEFRCEFSAGILAETADKRPLSPEAIQIKLGQGIDVIAKF